MHDIVRAVGRRAAGGRDGRPGDGEFGRIEADAVGRDGGAPRGQVRSGAEDGSCPQHEQHLAVGAGAHLWEGETHTVTVRHLTVGREIPSML